MQRISGWSAQNGRFVAEDPTSGVPGTIVSASWLNSVQEELCNLLERAGIELDGSDDAQLHRLLNGRAAHAPELADLRAPLGVTSLDGTVLATCETDAGLAVTTSTGKLYLVRGGAVALIDEREYPTQTDGWLPEPALWAAMHWDGARLLRVRLVTGDHGLVLKPDSFRLAPTNLMPSAAFPDGTQSEVQSRSDKYSDCLLHNATVDIHTDYSLVWGRFVDASHVVLLTHEVNQEARTDYLKLRVYWFGNDIHHAPAAYSEEVSRTGAYEWPSSTQLRQSTCGLAKLPDGRIVAVVPRNRSSASIVLVTIDDDNLAAAGTAAGSLDLPALIDGYVPKMRVVRHGTDSVLVYPRDGTSVCLYSLPASGDAVRTILNPGRRIIDALNIGPDRTVLFCADISTDYLRVISIDGQNPTSRLAFRVPKLSGRWSQAVWADRRAAGVDGAHYLPDRVVSRDGVVSVYLRGIALTTRSPLWGPWEARGIPPVLGALGMDDSGRAVLLGAVERDAVGRTAVIGDIRIADPGYGFGSQDAVEAAILVSAPP